MPQKVCFIISTIGEEGSPERLTADEKYDLVFEPVLKELKYTAIRADKESTPNSISRDIISRIIHSNLVIADVSDYNPNVFYELAIRNAVKRPVIVIKKPTQKLPFDIIDKRAISLDMTSNRQWVNSKAQLAEYIESAERDPDKASESILTDFDFQIDKNKVQTPQSSLSLELKDIKDAISRLSGEIAPGREVRPSKRSHTYPDITIGVASSIYRSGEEIHFSISAKDSLDYDFQLDVQLRDPRHNIVKSLPTTLSVGFKREVYSFGNIDPSWQKGSWQIVAWDVGHDTGAFVRFEIK